MKLTAALALALAAAAAPAAAQQGGATTDRNASDRTAAAGMTTGGFAELDRNNDGYLSRDEVRDAPWSNRFSEMDKDNDSRVSLGEYDAMMQQVQRGAAGATRKE